MYFSKLKAGCFQQEFMKVKLISIHKTNAAWIQSGLTEYSKRLSNYIPFEHIELEVNLQKLKTREAMLAEEYKKVKESAIKLKNSQVLKSHYHNLKGALSYEKIRVGLTILEKEKSFQ